MNEAQSENFQSYEEAMKWITDLMYTRGMKPGLDRMKWLMEKLGHPERKLKFIHIAGTNGKGSTCAFLGKVIRESGYDVGTFTSPYIEKFTNRIQYNGNDIPESEVVQIANRLKPLADELAQTEWGSLTMFEITTAIAILYFGETTYPDYVILETGLGGRLDSTNVVAPVLTIITNIGHDHMDLLGESIEEIAREKAGIIKPGVPLISAAEQPEVVSILEQVCSEKKSSLYMLGRQFHYQPVAMEPGNQVFDFSGPFRSIDRLAISLNGEHQYKNAAVAVMALEVLRQYYALIVDEEVLGQALKNTRWPGRLETVSEQPVVILDGAHNPEGAESLALVLQQLYETRRKHFMLGMLSNKDHRGFLRHILPIADSIIVTQPDYIGAYAAEKLEQIVREELDRLGNRHISVTVESDWKTALNQLKQSVEPNELAVVSGTLYMISDVRSWILHRSTSEKGW